jgi:wobble nucleotide-excising tRNase
VNSLSLDIPYLQQLESDHVAELNSINENMSKMKAAHEKAIMALEANFNEKLIVEYDKYQTLEVHTNKISEDYERYDWLTASFIIGAK